MNTLNAVIAALFDEMADQPRRVGACKAGDVPSTLPLRELRTRLAATRPRQRSGDLDASCV